MNGEDVEDALNWYVVYTHPKQEDRASNNLRAWGVETFAPKVRESRCNQYTGGLMHVVKNLFPRYIFARFNAHTALHNVRYTRGVNAVVRMGSVPVSVDVEIIKIIRSRIGDDGLIRIGEELNTGDEVIIKDGPLKDFVGIFEFKMNEADRVMILLKTINYQAHLVIERELVSKMH